jgi:Xaa-Pro dipeptidase
LNKLIGKEKSKIYSRRREQVYDWMARENIAMVMFEDAEGSRDSNIRWLSGMPQDALLFLSVEKKSLLVPWDINIAVLLASVDHIRSYAEFDRLPVKACRKAAVFFKIPRGSKVEIPPVTAYPRFLRFIEGLDDFDILCREEEGAGEELERLRAVKDEEEIGIYREASKITNELIDLLEKNLKTGKIKTEIDAALFIDTECRRRGCEGTGFETLAAGPSRSFAIHSFPPYTAQAFGEEGLSILDFGLNYSGYTTDVTVTVAKNPSRIQEKMLTLTEKAYKLAVSRARPGTATVEIAAAVDALFSRAGKAMPHALGHGIGLDPHEAPALRNRTDNYWVLAPGMVITIEPGLYDPLHGGCRLENDLLITGQGAELLTSSRIIRL